MTLENLRGISSVGRALALQAKGQEFDSPILHHHTRYPLNAIWSSAGFYVGLQKGFSEDFLVDA